MHSVENKVIFSKQKWWILIAMILAFAMIMADYTAIPVTLPKMQIELNTNFLMMQWVMNAYLLALTLFIIFGGKVGDQFGQRNVFLCGLFLFAFSSILIALATTITWVIIGRAFQGIGGAFMTPAMAVIVNHLFRAEERGTAMGIYVGVAVIFAALGPLIGGFSAEYISWRAVFWVNVPLAIMSFIISIKLIPIHLNEKPRQRHLDWLGLLFLTLMIFSVIFSLMEGAALGWSSYLIIGGFALGLLSLPVFIYVENKQSHPLIDLSYFKNKMLMLTLSLSFFTQIGCIMPIFWAVYLQSVLLFSPAKAGIAMLPIILSFIFMPIVGGMLMDKYGAKLPLILGTGGTTLALFWVALAMHLKSYLAILPGFIMFGTWSALVHSPTMTTALNLVEASDRGMISGLCSAAKNFGTTLGIALIGTIISNTSEISASHNTAYINATWLTVATSFFTFLLAWNFSKKV